VRVWHSTTTRHVSGGRLRGTQGGGGRLRNERMRRKEALMFIHKQRDASRAQSTKGSAFTL